MTPHMKSQRPISAKIARPTHTLPVQRTRLYALLDATLVWPVTWISAPGGAGKSTLVASYLDSRQLPCIWYQCDDGDADLATFFYYMGLAARHAAPRHRKPLPLLTAEYLAGIPAFTRRYFESLYNRLLPRTPHELEAPVFVIVLDNYQDVPADSPFHDMIATGFAGIPVGIRFVVLSRSEAPPALARMQASDRLALIDYDALRFTLHESCELAAGRLPELERERIVRMHERTRGWAAGMILMLERRAQGNDAPDPGGGLAREKVFDYFANEIFNGTEDETRDFLLKSSLLPTISVSQAKLLTGCADAARILSDLNRRHLFTDRLSGNDQLYQYHPLLREYLLNRARTVFSAESLATLRHEAALILEQAGEMDDAAQLFCESGNPAGLARMVHEHGRKLLIQGRSRTLSDWLACIPGEMMACDPWLMYWDGMCSFPMDLPRTRSLLEQAFSVFRSLDDAAGCYLAWAGIVDTHAYGDEWKPLDDCLADFDELQRRFPLFPSTEVELTASSRKLLALTLRKTDQPLQVEGWLQRVTLLLQQKPSFDIQLETVFCMSVFYLWRGEYDKNAILLERAEQEVRHRHPSPFAFIRIKLMLGIHCWITARYQETRQKLGEGLEVSAQSGVHLYDSLLWSFTVAADLATGNLADGEDHLRHQQRSLLGMESALNLFFYHINAAWLALLAGNPSRAAEHLETVASRTESMGTPYYRALWQIGMAQAVYRLGQAVEAEELLNTALRIALTMKSQVLEWNALLIASWVLLQQGKRTEGLLSLHRALTLGRRHGYVHLEFYQPAVMRFLFATALEERIEPEYVREQIGVLALSPPVSEGRLSAVQLGEWPYPVRIYTLGRFNIFRGDEPLHFSGKEQKKPLELLKALIARGGQDVLRERLTDMLWPDADGDLALKSLETTLGRLRRLLGRDDVILSHSRHLSLNPLVCWVDSLALEQLTDSMRDAGDARLLPLGTRGLTLYRGGFLPADSVFSWVVACRETLRNRLLRVILMMGRAHEQAAAWESAADCYVRGIEIDPLAEELYRRLMICQRNLGNHSDVARTYNRCNSLLRSELGIDPSPETYAVYTAIVQPS